MTQLIPLPKPMDLLKQQAQAKSGLPPLFIDDREARMHGQIVTALELEGIPCVIERSDFGDYWFTGAINTRLGRSPRIAIELSTVSDVVGKLNNDRLAFQLSNMLLQFDVAILMISSLIQVSSEGYVVLPRMPKACSYDRLMDVLAAAQAHGVILINCAGTENVPKRLAHLVRYYSKDEGDHKYFRPQNVNREVTIPIGPEIDKRIQALMALPGIGEQRAVDALKTFGSVRNVMLASESGLREIPGWGELTARKVYTFLAKQIVETLPCDVASPQETLPCD